METAVLPLYDAPRKSPGGDFLFGFLMQSFLFAEFAEFFKFQTLGRVLFILFRLIIQIMADGAFQINKMVLGHWFEFIKLL